MFNKQQCDVMNVRSIANNVTSTNELSMQESNGEKKVNQLNFKDV